MGSFDWHRSLTKQCLSINFLGSIENRTLDVWCEQLKQIVCCQHRYRYWEEHPLPFGHAWKTSMQNQWYAWDNEPIWFCIISRHALDNCGFCVVGPERHQCESQWYAWDKQPTCLTCLRSLALRRIICFNHNTRALQTQFRYTSGIMSQFVCVSSADLSWIIVFCVFLGTLPTCFRLLIAIS